jgi:DNA polymerase-3 subunit delta
MKLDVDLRAPVYLLRGDDEVLLEDTAVELVHALVGSGDRTLMVEELDAARYENDAGDYQIGPLVDSAQTPPFLTDRRVVVGRHAAVFSTAAAVAPLVDYLADPLESTSLVLVWEKGPKTGAKLNKAPTKLLDAIKKAGGTLLDTGAGSGKARTQWLDDHLRDAPVVLDASARKLIADQIGEDAGRLVGLLPTLAAVFGDGAKVTAADLGPYLGAEGGARPFDLTDAIDRADVTTALDLLNRIMVGSGWHPLQVTATLTNHFTRMLALDGAGVADEKAAAEVLGIKGSTFPAKKALTQSRKLGSERLAEFVGLLAQADLDLKGAKAWPPELVVEVLVARLASRTPRSSPARSGYAGRR